MVPIEVRQEKITKKKKKQTNKKQNKTKLKTKTKQTVEYNDVTPW